MSDQEKEPLSAELLMPAEFIEWAVELPLAFRRRLSIRNLVVLWEERGAALVAEREAERQRFAGHINSARIVFPPGDGSANEAIDYIDQLEAAAIRALGESDNEQTKEERQAYRAHQEDEAQKW